MKKLFLLTPFALAIGIFSSCSNESSQSPAPDSEATAELSFEISLNDNPLAETKATEGTPDQATCASIDSLNAYSSRGELFAGISLVTPPAVEGAEPDTVNHTIQIIKVEVPNAQPKYITAPMILAPNTYTVIQATVYKEVGAETTLLFSAVNEGSAYEKYVSNTLPEHFNIGTPAVPNNYQTIGLYEKGTVSLDLFCVLKETAEDFGFVKWNFRFMRLICMQFAVNMCDEYGEDMVATGTLVVRSGALTADDIFLPAQGSNQLTNHIPPMSDTIPFGVVNGVTQLGDVCIFDDLSRLDTNEYFEFTLRTTSPKVYAKSVVVTVDELLKYRESGAWEADFNFIHLIFCDDYDNYSQKWFFAEGFQPSWPSDVPNP